MGDTNPRLDRIFGKDSEPAVAVPRTAILYEGDTARIWVARDDKALELRQIKLGMPNGNLIQVVEGLTASDRVVTRGSIFIGRSTAGT
jgi:membrane fusion protein, heavy metal efflux system